MPEGRGGDTEFLGDAPDRLLALVVFLNNILYILLRVSHVVLMKLSSRNACISSKIDLVVVS